MVSKTLPSSLGMLIVSTENVLCMNYPRLPPANLTAHPSIVKGPARWLMGETGGDPGEVCHVLLALDLICFSCDLHLPPCVLIKQAARAKENTTDGIGVACSCGVTA